MYIWNVGGGFGMSPDSCLWTPPVPRSTLYSVLRTYRRHFGKSKVALGFLEPTECFCGEGGSPYHYHRTGTAVSRSASRLSPGAHDIGAKQQTKGRPGRTLNLNNSVEPRRLGSNARPCVPSGQFLGLWNDNRISWSFQFPP